MATLEEQIKAAEERAKAAAKKARELKAKQEAKEQKENIKVLKEIFGEDMPTNSKEFKKFFEELAKYAEVGLKYEERMRAQKDAQKNQVGQK